MHLSRRALLMVAVVVIAVGVSAGAWWLASRPVVLPAPTLAATPVAVSQADFVGAQRCAACHATEFAAWRRSTHGRAGGDPGARAIAPFDGAPIRFRDATVTPRVERGVYEFLVRPHGDTAIVLRVDGVLGGGHIYGGGTQGYLTANADGTLRFLPFEWSRQAQAWFCNTNARSGRGWARITAEMNLAECGDWPPVRVVGDNPRFANCQSCHASQATLVLDTLTRRYATRLTSLEINCESCHGPGRRHVEIAERADSRDDPDIGMASIATLGKDAALQVCYQCHAVKDQIREGFLSGDSLAAFYSLKLPLLGDRPLHPDGRVRTFAYQEGHQFSDCYLDGGMTCTSCHDPHDQSYRDVNGSALRGRFDDRQCTSCHASLAERSAAHTRHRSPVACTSCHMPLRQEPDTRPASERFASARVVPYARSDHTISIPRPSVDAALGFASACAACHPTMSVAQQDSAIRARWGEVKPLRPDVAAQLGATERRDSAATLLLGGAGGGGETREGSEGEQTKPNAFARFAGASRYLEEHVRADVPLEPEALRRLRLLARDQDEDTRAVALATLHLAQGGDRSTRRFLARSLVASAGHDAGLRARWAIVLGYMGDRLAAAGNTGDAVAAYSRALEVQPANARLLLSLANVRRDAGDLADAVEAYQRSVALDRNAPLTWVNFGIALGAIGDTAAAITALNNAATLDPGEALAWYNLANLMFVRRDLGRAREMYERAARLDPAMAPAHFQLARLALLAGDKRSALVSLRRGLAFDSSDASARAMAAELTRRLEYGPSRP